MDKAEVSEEIKKIKNELLKLEMAVDKEDFEKAENVLKEISCLLSEIQKESNEVFLDHKSETQRR